MAYVEMVFEEEEADETGMTADVALFLEFRRPANFP